MPRPHVEFIQAQGLAWEASPWRHLAGCHAKLLSRDPEGGAATALVRFPADWRVALPGRLDCAQEIFLLEGGLELNGRRCDPDCYASLPAGYGLHSLASPAGAVSFMCFDREPRWLTGPGAASGDEAGRPFELRDACALPWQPGGTGAAPALPGPEWKVLRGSPPGDAATLLVYLAPHVHPPLWRGPQAVHSCATELFLLSGDLICHAGQLFVGAYLWRPPGLAHGPYGTRGGSLALVRTLGGSFFGRPTVHEVEIARDAAPQPVLPESMRAQRQWSWRPQRF